MMPLHAAGRPMHDCLAEDTEKALLLEKLGYDELFIGEHYSAATEPYPAPLQFAASLLPRTERLVFGTGVINAPLHHPAMIAAEAAQFDHLSKGRFILGIGSAPSSAIRAWSLGSFSTVLIPALSLSMISVGVPFGTAMP